MRLALCEEIVAVCRELEADDRIGTHAVELRRARSRLSELLRVAVGGKFSTGKSTLVNALLGRVVADARPEETRRITTVFRYDEGMGEQADVVLRENAGVAPEQHSIGFTPDGIVADVPAHLISRADRVEVRLNAPELKTLTLVDTPGLFSADETVDFSERGKQSLGVGTYTSQTSDAVRAADALVFLIGDAASAVDRQVLRELLIDLGWRKSGFAAVAVLGKADALGTDDPFQAARVNAAEARTDLRGAVCDVVPVSALMAETAATGRLTATDLSLLADLAATAEEGDFKNAQWFELAAPFGDPGQRRRLVRLLGMFGLRHCIALLRGGLPADALPARLHERSGLPAVQTMLTTQFVHNADIIKAATALSQLETYARSIATVAPWLAERITDEAERLRRRPAFHRVREVEVLNALDSDGPPAGLGRHCDEIVRLMLHAADGYGADLDLVTARSRRAWWHRFADDPGRMLPDRRAAEVIVESYRRRIRELKEQP